MSKKVLFVHDGPIYHDALSGSFYGLHYSDQLVERYRYLGDMVTFLMRVKRLEPNDVNGYSRITASDFGVIEIPNFKSIRSYFKNKPIAKSVIHKAVANHDIIVCRLPSSAGAIAYNEAIRKQKPVLVEVVACVFDALWNYDWRGKLLAHQRYYYYRRLIQTAPFVLYVTERFLQSRYPTNGTSVSCSDVVLSPVNDDVLQTRIDRNKLRRPGAPFILGTIAALDVPYKGQADVIRAVGRLKTKGLSFIYKLVGQGDPATLLNIAKECDVEDSIEVVGPLPHNEIFTFLQSIDVYIQPSKQEGLPRSIIEAISVACPCIGSTIGGIPELLDQDCLYNTSDFKRMDNILESVTAEWLHQKSVNNFNKSKHFQNNVLESRRLEFYDKLTEYYFPNMKTL